MLLQPHSGPHVLDRKWENPGCINRAFKTPIVILLCPLSSGWSPTTTLEGDGLLNWESDACVLFPVRSIFSAIQSLLLRTFPNSSGPCLSALRLHKSTPQVDRASITLCLMQRSCDVVKLKQTGGGGHLSWEHYVDAITDLKKKKSLRINDKFKFLL